MSEATGRNGARDGSFTDRPPKLMTQTSAELRLYRPSLSGSQLLHSKRATPPAQVKIKSLLPAADLTYTFLLSDHRTPSPARPSPPPPSLSIAAQLLPVLSCEELMTTATCGSGSANCRLVLQGVGFLVRRPPGCPS